MLVGHALLGIAAIAEIYCSCDKYIKRFDEITAIAALIWQYCLVLHIRLYGAVKYWANVRIMVKGCNTNGTLQVYGDYKSGTHTNTCKYSSGSQVTIC